MGQACAHVRTLELQPMQYPAQPCVVQGGASEGPRSDLQGGQHVVQPQDARCSVSQAGGPACAGPRTPAEACTERFERG